MKNEIVELTDELLDKLGEYYQHPATNIIHPWVKDITFDQFVQRMLRTYQDQALKKNWLREGEKSIPLCVL